MSGYALTPAAQVDLDQIWIFSAGHWGIDRANDYVRDIGRAARHLAQFPNAGVDAAAFRPGYRKHAVRSHVIYYRMAGRVVEIVRILGHRMDPDAHL